MNRIEWPILSHSDPIQFSQVTPVRYNFPDTPRAPTGPTLPRKYTQASSTGLLLTLDGGQERTLHGYFCGGADTSSKR